MDMVAILFKSAEPCEQIAKNLSTEGPMLNLVKSAQVVPEKRTFKDSREKDI